jgi:hypothetical protein
MIKQKTSAKLASKRAAAQDDLASDFGRVKGATKATKLPAIDETTSYGNPA